MMFNAALSDSSERTAGEFVSLRVRLLRPLVWLSITAAALGALGIYFISSSQLKGELQLRGQLLSSAIIIAAETSSSVADLQRIVLAMAAEPNLDSIIIVDQNYQPIFPGEQFDAHKDPRERQELDQLSKQALAHNRSVGALDRINRGIYHVITPIHVMAQRKDALSRPETVLLFVNLRTEASEQKALKTTLFLTVLFCGLGITALLLIYWLMNHWVLKPSLQIVEVMQTQSLRMVATTGFAPIHELGLIGQTFDTLSKTLDAREHALEAALAQAQDASQAKSQFLANISHELRTPMNAILGMLALLRKTELTPRQSDYASKIDGAARSLLSLLNDILDISKAEAGKMELDPTPFNLDKLLRDLGVILATNLTHKPVELQFEVGEEVPRYLFGDAMRLQQVLINLGGNAVKFTERGNVVIRISQNNSSAEKSTLLFSVQDSGIGIAEENQRKIFSGFTQAEASTTRRFGGTGLGLAISRKLVELMGGTLQLESQLGTGSRFYFSLEFTLLNALQIGLLNQATQEQTQAATAQRLHNMAILLVEDNLNNQQIATELLEAEGARVQIANHGQEALDMLSQNTCKTGAAQFDVVLMDVQMPVMDGLTATGLIRRDLGLTQLPIIAMTANAMASDKEACLRAGMNDHVGKPFDLAILIEVLCRHTRWQQSDYETNTTMEEKNSQQQHDVSIADKPGAQDFADINGIDLTGALSRLGGNKSLYLKMLPKLLTTLEQTPARLQTLLAAADFISLARELHSLKGISATMGLSRLAEFAAAAEQRLLADATEACAEAVTKQLNTELINSMALINALQAQLPDMH